VETKTSTPAPKKFWFFFGIISILAGSLGYLLWRVVGYWQRLLRQPFLMPLSIPTGLESHEKVEAKGLLIASANLQAAIEKRRLLDGQEKLVLCAGLRNFREPWARDLSFASFGLVELERFQVVKEACEVFLINQRPDGQFPVKVHSTSILDRYFHSLFKREQPTQFPIKPKYITAHNTISLDGNGLLVIAILNYVHRSGDYEFARNHWWDLKRAITWMEGHALHADGLLHQAAFTDWADSIARTGRVLYTNMIYWKAVHDLAVAAPLFGRSEDAAYFDAKAEGLKESINTYFWRDNLGYYVTSQLFDNLGSSGNLLAIAWNLTTVEQAHSILNRMAEFEMATPIPTQVVHRAYPSKFIALENRLGGVPHYHTYAAWLWLGAWHVIALTRMKRLTEAEELLYRMSSVIVREGAVHEVYDPNGYPLSSFWYTSEAPLTWSAGMFVYAYYVYQRHLAEAEGRALTKLDLNNYQETRPV
jgi:GH15 family glucan-1,4-alpha-glucosidase